MSNVKEIKMLEADISEWHLAGPLGIPVSWKATTTENTPPLRLAWRSIEGSLENTGFISVTPQGTGSLVTVHVEYNPPLGAVGEAVAELFKDPQTMLEHDLAQLENLISSGISENDLDKTSETDRSKYDEKMIVLPNLISPGLIAPGGMPGSGVIVGIPPSDTDLKEADLKEKLR